MGIFKSTGRILGGITSSLVGGTASTLGTDSGTIMSGIPFLGEGFAAKNANDFSAQQAQKQMDFQREMSNTAHQREVADLRAAGLNPILSAGGSGSSSPSGAMATGQAGSGAGSSAKFIQAMFNLERDQARASINKDKADTELANETKEVQKKQTEVLTHTAKEAKANAEIRENQKITSEKDREFEEKWGTRRREADSLFNYLQKGTSSARDLMQTFGPKGPSIQLPPSNSNRWLKPH